MLYQAPIPIEIQQSSDRSVQGTLNFPMPETFFVRSDGPVSSQESALNSAGRFFTSVNAAFNACTANKDQRIVCLPGHTETISTANFWSNIKAGVSVLGWGRGTRRPKLTWSAAAATILLSSANVCIQNFQMEMAGDVTASSALTVAAPITVSAAGCGIYGCAINWGVDADQLVTIGVTTDANADDFEFIGNRCYGNSAAEATTFMRIVGADRCRIIDNIIAGATSSVNVGVLQALTTASLDIEVANNSFRNYKAASVSAVVGMAGLTGVVRNNLFGILNDSLLVGFTTPGSTQGSGNYTVNLAGEQGGATTPIST